MHTGIIPSKPCGKQGSENAEHIVEDAENQRPEKEESEKTGGMDA